MKNQLPKVSFIMPTYNAERCLKASLESALSLDYPKNEVEIIVADGGSSDKTLSILKSFERQKNFSVISNPKKVAEDGKYLAYKKAKGEFLVLLDSDNVIASRDWLKKLIKPLLEDNSIIGTESNYLVNKDFTSINAYATLLVIVDPVARMLASRPQKTENRNDYVIKTYAIGSSPVSGANGFIWRKKVIDNHIRGSQLNETNLLWKIAQKEKVLIANVPGIGIYHYYCDSVWDYLKKRQKIAKKFLKRQTVENTWVDKGKGNQSLYLPTLYLATVIGPTLEAGYNLLKHNQIPWLWHPFISLSTVGIYIYYSLINTTRNKKEKL